MNEYSERQWERTYKEQQEKIAYLQKRVAELEAANEPVKLPVLAFIPCSWEEAPCNPSNLNYRLVMGDNNMPKYDTLHTSSYPVYEVALCTEVNEIMRRVEADARDPELIKKILIGIGLLPMSR